MHRTTRLCTDASRRGIGFVLQQQTPAGKWVLVQAGSRFLSTAESRYAIIELEMLAVVWAASKCKLFLTGMQHFQVITDHNPLIPILNNHRLDEIDNPRLQRLKMKLMAFNFTAKWCKGNTNRAPDALSRNPVWKPQQVDALAEYDEDNQPEPSAAEIRSIINQECTNTGVTRSCKKGRHIPAVERGHPARLPRPQEPTSREAEAVLAGAPGAIHRG